MESTRQEAMDAFGVFLDLVDLHRARISNMISEPKAGSEKIADEVHASAKEAGRYLIHALPTDSLTLPMMDIIIGALAKSYNLAMDLATNE